jgi:UDP-glucose 4-epimerase
MKTLVTGIAGFIGSHVAENLLHSGYEVVGIDDLSGGFIENVPLKAEFIEGNICDHQFVDRVFAEHKFDIVYHLAAYAAEGLSHYIKRYNYTNNIGGSVNLLTSAVVHGAKLFVFASSIAVYGDAVCPVTEDTVPSPIDPYGIAKYAFEMELEATRKVFNLPYIIFRPHNVYGERQNIADPYRNVIGIFIRQMMNGHPLTIFGDGHQTRAFTYIGDIVSLFVKAVEDEKCRNKVFNIGSDRPYEILQISKMVANEFGIKNAPVKHLKAREEPKHSYADHTKINNYFGKVRQTGIEDGIAMMVKWAKSKGVPKKTILPPVEIPFNLPETWADTDD